jgi:hypothetical protein
VIGSDTAPVSEVINRENGILVPFFDINQLADRVIEVLATPRRFHSLRVEARRIAVERYDLQRVCLPEMMRFLGRDGGKSARRSSGPMSWNSGDNDGLHSRHRPSASECMS